MAAAQDDPVEMMTENKGVFIQAVRDLQAVHHRDDVPDVQVDALSISYEAASLMNPVNSMDSVGFHSEFERELKAVAQIEQLLDLGEYHIQSLYTFRSVSKAIPPVPATSPNKDELDRKTYEVLAPYVNKIKELMDFQEEAVKVFVANMQELSNNREKTVPEGYYDALIKVIDTLQKLDNLKDMKPSLKDDFSRFKRVFNSVRADLPNATALTTEHFMITSFLSGLPLNNSGTVTNRKLGQQLQIIANLSAQVKKVPAFDEILYEMLEQCREYLEEERFTTPDEKYRYLRALPIIMLLIDNVPAEDEASPTQPVNVFKDKRTNKKALMKLFKRYPVVPEYGDMAIDMGQILNKCENFPEGDADSWGVEPPMYGPVSREYAISSTFFEDQAKHSRHIAIMSQLNVKLRATPFQKELGQSGGSGGVEFAKEVAESVKTGMRLLQQWTCKIQEMCAWKTTHACPAEIHGRVLDVDKRGLIDVKYSESGVLAPRISPELVFKVGAATDASTDAGAVKKGDKVIVKQGGDPASPARDYEMVIRYNLSKQELTFVVDYISMIKSLSSLMVRMEGLAAPWLRMFMHHRIQQLAQGDLVPALHRAYKHKRDIMTGLLNLRRLVADWDRQQENENDYRSYSRKGGREEVVVTDHPVRVVSVSATQFQLMRTIVRSMYDEKNQSKFRTGIFSSGKSDLEKIDIEMLETFFVDIFHFPYLLNYSHTIRACSDLGDLWYREWYLDITKQVQFPIEASFPWILSEHIIKNQNNDVPLVEKMIFVLDLYNDAANRALFVLNQQFLYDEIEAEVNLVFDQLIFLISDEMYKYYKNKAAVSLLHKSLKESTNKYGAKKFAVHKRRYEVPISQRHIQLLGRTIDLNFLIGQHINQKITKDIDVSIKRFEADEFSGILELHSVLQTIRATHAELSPLVELDSFDTIYAEVNESVTPVAFSGRILLHVLKTLVTDVFTNYAYNLHTNRFVKGNETLATNRPPFNPDSAPKNVPKTFGHGTMCGRTNETVDELRRHFVGKEHMEAMVSLLGSMDMPFLINHISENVAEKLGGVDDEEMGGSLNDYINGFGNCIPPLKLQPYMLKFSGNYMAIETGLKPILEFDDLKPEVFQTFREIGNMIAFVKDMSEAIDRINTTVFLDSVQFVHGPAAAAGLAGMGTEEEEAKDEGSSSEGPFVEAMESFIAYANNNPDKVKEPQALAELGHASRQACGLYQSSHLTPALFTSFLQKVDNILDEQGLREEWGAGRAECDDLIDIQSTTEYHRVWSALNFLFCLRESEDENGDPMEFTDHDQFGDGFAMAGCLFLHLLGQGRRYEMLDFSLHVLRVHAHEQRSVNTSAFGINAEALRDATSFVASAAFQTTLHRQCAALYDRAYPKVPPSVMLTFKPPPNDSPEVLKDFVLASNMVDLKTVESGVDQPNHNPPSRPPPPPPPATPSAPDPAISSLSAEAPPVPPSPARAPPIPPAATPPTVPASMPARPPPRPPAPPAPRPTQTPPPPPGALPPKPTAAPPPAPGGARGPANMPARPAPPPLPSAPSRQAPLPQPTPPPRPPPRGPPAS